MSSFVPPCCPNESCPSRLPGATFTHRPAGQYVRKVDGRVVPRIRCLTCERRFSEQTFRADYFQKKPALNEALYPLLVSKVSHRQAARVVGCNRKSVMRRIPLLGRIARAVHEHLAPRRDPAAFLKGGFLLDELETFAKSRRNDPLTVPAVVHDQTLFVVHVEVGPLPRRGGTGRDEAEPDPLSEEERAERNRGSKVAVRACLDGLAKLVPSEGRVQVGSDMKHAYPEALCEVFGERLEHTVTHSTVPRTADSPLATVNHLFAQMRDGVSRLVRRNWGHSKLASQLRHHLWVWVSYRNYVRGITNGCWEKTAAMVVGACSRKLAAAEILRWAPAYVAMLLAA